MIEFATDAGVLALLYAGMQNAKEGKKLQKNLENDRDVKRKTGRERKNSCRAVG